MCVLLFCFFFFKQKPAYEMRISDWSSDVCSSDLHALQTFTHLLTGEINVRGVRKDGGDLREAIAAQRARIFKAGSAGERGFDRERHLLLDQLGRERGCADVNLDLIIGDVRHRVDRSEEHTSKLQSPMRISYAVFCLKRTHKNT